MKRKIKRYTKLFNNGKITLSGIHKCIAKWLSYVEYADSDGLLKSMF